MDYSPVEAGVRVLPIRTLRDMDVEKEATRTYWCRVLIGNTLAPAPLHCEFVYVLSRKLNSGFNYYLAIQYIGSFFRLKRNMLDFVSNIALKLPDFGGTPAFLYCSNPLDSLDFIAFKYYRA